MINIIGIVITTFLAVILFTKKEKSFSDNILLIWLIVIIAHLFFFALISTGNYIRFPHLLGFEIPLPLLQGPLIYLYTKSLTDLKSTNSKILLHFIPFLIALISIFPFLLLNSNMKISVYQNGGESYSTLKNIIFISIILSGIIYTVLSLFSLIKYQRKIEHNFSYTEKINLRWLYGLIIGISLIWLMILIADDEAIYSAVVCYVIFIGYFGIKQVGIFTNSPPRLLPLASQLNEPKELHLRRNENIKYDKSSLTNSELKIIHEKLAELMRENKLFLTSELSLATVAAILDVHPNTLSQVINRVEKKNFFEYINNLRVDEFKEKVSIPLNHKKYTLLSLSYECGFNSKTSFNRNFKNITGKSPSDYLKEINVTLQ